MFESITTFSVLLTLIFLVVFLILLTLLAVLVYSGIFYGIEEVGTGKPPVRQLIIAYKFQKGPYNEAGQIFTEAAIVAPENKAIGIYYDDPKKVHVLQLRYIVGSIIAEGDAPVDENMVKQFTEKGFKILHLPEVTYAVQTSFPHITSLSILIGVHKAYPRLEAYIEEHKLCAHPFMEYYDGKNIHFFAPLSKQDEFYVPECTNEAAGASGDMDRTQSEADSASEFNESQTSLNLTQTTVDHSLDQNESILEDDKASETGNQAEPDMKPSQGGSNDEDGSDDSSSSFEVIKKDA